MPSTGHTSIPKGKRAFVSMRDGNHFVAKFRKKDKHVLYFEDHDPIHVRRIRTMSIYKEPPPVA